jgi:hypothetical protein
MCLGKILLGDKVGRHFARIPNCNIGITGVKVHYFICPNDLGVQSPEYRTPLWQAEDQPSAGKCIWARHTQGLLLGIFRRFESDPAVWQVIPRERASR